MADKLKRYAYDSDDITVTYVLKRCIHAEECVHGLPDVFDPKAKPWIQPESSEADAIAEVVERCPTGALHYSRKDGGSEEATPSENTIRVAPDGPLYVRGDISVETADGDVLLNDTRIALCRCGASKHKPFCDNSHLKSGFADPGEMGSSSLPQVENAEGPLAAALAANGPILLRGNFSLTSADGEVLMANKAALCRCGSSGNKPFCDGTHRSVGFEG